MRRQLRDARVLITGASAGIGRALAEACAQAGTRLLLTARRADRLTELATSLRDEGVACDWLAGDITDSNHRRALAAWIDDHWQALDCLINNAGVGAIGPFARADEQRLRAIMEVNFFAPAELIRTMLPRLQAGRAPAIININSVLGHRAVPNKSEYCASKFALHGLSDSLRLEFREAGIDLIVVSPSTTSSEFFDRLLAADAPDAKLKNRPSSPAEVARQTLRAWRRGRR